VGTGEKTALAVGLMKGLYCWPFIIGGEVRHCLGRRKTEEKKREERKVAARSIGKFSMPQHDEERARQAKVEGNRTFWKGQR